MQFFAAFLLFLLFLVLRSLTSNIFVVNLYFQYFQDDYEMKNQRSTRFYVISTCLFTLEQLTLKPATAWCLVLKKSALFFLTYKWTMTQISRPTRKCGCKCQGKKRKYNPTSLIKSTQQQVIFPLIHVQLFLNKRIKKDIHLHPSSHFLYILYTYY